jgi:hypothetical protein
MEPIRPVSCKGRTPLTGPALLRWSMMDAWFINKILFPSSQRASWHRSWMPPWVAAAMHPIISQWTSTIFSTMCSSHTELHTIPNVNPQPLLMLIQHVSYLPWTWTSHRTEVINLRLLVDWVHTLQVWQKK